MTKDKTTFGPKDLRRWAEARLKSRPADLKTVSSPEAQDLLHELQVHQVMLEMQNEKLRQTQAELETGRIKYTDLYDFAPVGYLTLDQGGLILEANLTAANLLGVARGSLLKKSLLNFIVREDQNIYSQLHQKLLEPGAPKQCKLRMAKRDGSLFWGQIEAIVVGGRDETLVCRLTISDITERKRAEEALESANQQLLSIFNGIDDAIYVSTPDTYQLLYVNEAFRRSWGDDVIGRRCFEVLQNRKSPCSFCTNKLIFGEHLGKAFFWEFQNQVTQRWFRCADKAIRWVDERMVRFELAIDITETKQIEGNLRRTRDYLDKLIRHANAPIIVWDPNSRITRFNNAFENITGYATQEVVGQKLDLLFPEASREESLSKIALTTGGGYWETVEIPILCKNGDIRLVLWNSSNILDGDGTTLVATIAQGQDITERKRGEETLVLHTVRQRALLDLHLLAEASQEQVLDFVLEASCTSLQSKLAFIGLVDKAESTMTIHRWSKDGMALCAIDDKPILYPVSEAGSWGECIRRRQAVLVNDYQAPHPGKRGLPEGHMSIQRFLAVPVLEGGRVVAVAAVANKDKDYTEDDVGAFTLLINKTWELLRRRQSEEALRQSQELNRSFFENLLNGFAYCQMVFEQNQPQDFIFLDVNRSFEALTGLQNVVGKKVSEVIPGIRESDPELFGIFGRVALTGKPERFETSVEALKMWFNVLVYSPGRGYFAAVFDVITERKRTEESLAASYEKLRCALSGTLQALSAIVETRDPYTRDHQRRVAHLAGAISQEMGLSQDQCEGIEALGLLHDIGKLAVPAEILSKPGKLSEMELNLIKTHAQVAYDILKDIGFPGPIALAVLQHHERLDGSGYPQGLTGPDIILESRTLAVADVVSAMTSQRPYRPALGIDQALEEITKNEGTLYDPEVVKVCVKLFTEKGFVFE